MSVAARLLGLRVRIPFVSVVFCQAEVSETCRSLVQRSPTDCGVCVCVCVCVSVSAIEYKVILYTYNT